MSDDGTLRWIGDLSAEQLDQLIRSLQPGAQPVAAPDPVRPRERPDGRSPLSFGQQQLWLIERIEPGTAVFNLPAALECQGSLDVDALRQALDEIVRRHEVLRARFEIADGVPVQVVGPAVPFELMVHDLAALPPEERLEEAGRCTAEEASAPFDLAAGPLLRAALLRLAPDSHRLLLTLHHIAADAWSVGVLVRELGELYAAFATGRPSPLAPLPVHYADYAAWQREHLQGETLTGLLDHWRQVLEGRPAGLELPADHPRPPLQTLRGARARVDLGSRAAAARRLGGEEGASLFMVLLAAFETLLLRVSGQDDLLVGTPVANRRHPSVEGLIGFFVNTLVLRCHLDGDPTFRAALARVRAAALDAFAHDEIPFSSLVDALKPDRDLSRNPLFQVFFATQHGAEMDLRLPGLTLSPVNTHPGATQFDLSLTLDEGEERLEGWLEYNPDLFEAATAQRLAGHLALLLAGGLDAPDRRLSELPLLS
ncbi:MAG TPA: condensation domain-containing protein, partial [Thermoanaerobaculia bacterium]